jgi:hypothetical protein
MCLYVQIFSGSVDGVSCYPLVLKMGITKGKATPLRLLLGRRHLSAAGGGKQRFQFSWHNIPPSSVALI